MSKERLEEIEVRLKYGLGCLKNLRRKILNSNDESLKDQINLLENDIKYLFEQAERVQELEGDVRMHERVSYRNIERNIKLEQQNKRYREALEFYAEQDNYVWETSYRPQQEIDCMVIDDGGHTARKALKGGYEW